VTLPSILARLRELPCHRGPFTGAIGAVADTSQLGAHTV
jgi:hypothetical protein